MELHCWRTDEPCPSCGTGLTLLDDGRPVLRAECRMCGYAELWGGDDEADGDDW